MSERLPYSNQPQHSNQSQHRQQQPQQQPQQHTAAHQMGGYMMQQESQPTWGGGGGARQPQHQYGQQPQQQANYYQQIYQQQQQQYGTGNSAAAAAAGGGGMMPQHHQAMVGGGHQNAYMHQQLAAMPQQMQVLQPRPGRLTTDRPIMKLSVGLIETYKEINKVRMREMMSYCLAYVGLGLMLRSAFGRPMASRASLCKSYLEMYIIVTSA